MKFLSQPEIINKQEIRCFCAAKPILAIAGIDKTDNRLVIHQKVWKGPRLYSESFTKGGEILIRCRVCFRLHRINIKEGTERVELELIQESTSGVGASA